MEILLLSVIFFFAVFTQSTTGFGSALVAMAILPEILGIQVAAPLVALLALTIETVLVLRYRQALNLQAVGPLALASLAGIPLGVWALRGLDERLALLALGLVITGYAVYALFNLRLPELHGAQWAYLAGFIAGLLGGAYNTSGPPVVIYADCRRWSPAEFKANLQGFFVVNSILVVLGRLLSGDITVTVWRHYLWGLPAILLGLAAGKALDRFIKPEVFRKIVLALLVVMGLRMALAG